VLLIKLFARRARDALSKGDLVDTPIETMDVSQSQRHRSISSATSFNDMSRNALIQSNQGNLVKTSIAFHHHHQQSSSTFSLPIERHCQPMSMNMNMMSAGNGWV